MQICFVCDGNTCRSVFAEKLFAKMLKTNGISGISVISRGLNVTAESKTNENVIELLKKFGVTYKGKKAQKLTNKVLTTTNLFITMTSHQKNYIKAKNVYSLGELAGGEDIDDPYGKGYDAYEYMAQKVSEYLNVLINKLKNMKELQ